MLIVHGLDLSYFTGKLEGYLRAKGLAYRLQEMDTRAFRRLGRITGVRQMPQLELPDGRWMTDTVRIMDTLEVEHPEPTLTPADPVCALIAGLIETFGDEHLWRPALYYRWACADDARLMSGRLAQGMLRDVPGPLALKRQFILMRQRAHYLRGEGVTATNRLEIEADYLDLLDALEPVLRRRDWVLGPAPTRADIGLFGPLFRHFHCDPTPGRILRARAPAVAAWVTRLWALEGVPAADARSLDQIPDDLAPLFALIRTRFLPELVANAMAVATGQGDVVHHLSRTAPIRYRSNPYRAARLARLQRDHVALETPARARVTAILGVDLSGPLFPPAPTPPLQPDGLRDRRGRPTR
ncbi:MAG: glutathione S-transferase family protein [Brevundimonas sp.]|uniref:glutathione S-transferase family protein n=1 Tax=Brevundimonas sp. TaxID=1871086 RepID=UPI0027373E27|nr:glutathione S-transferase family protein [Brevundimonas sp.]MDP3404127.1 glutathione S-transferase family protein [Brevundimonas sp.]